MSDPITYTQALYWALRSTKKFDFNEHDYFWRIGARVLQDLEIAYPLQNTATTLYGINVEIDFVDLENIRLYEDITFKIGEIKKIEDIKE